MSHHWVRTRVTQELVRNDGMRARCLLGERDDGGVFFQMFHYKDEQEHDGSALENAKLNLDRFLNDPLSESSVGQFDVEPNFYVPGMSPGKL